MNEGLKLTVTLHKWYDKMKNIGLNDHLVFFDKQITQVLWTWMLRILNASLRQFLHQESVCRKSQKSVWCNAYDNEHQPCHKTHRLQNQSTEKSPCLKSVLWG